MHTNIPKDASDTHLNAPVNYTVTFNGQTTLQFSDIACNLTGHCALTVNGSQLFNNERYFIAVMGYSVIGSGRPTIFPNQSRSTNI